MLMKNYPTSDLSELEINDSIDNETNMLEKLENVAPYNLFFNKIPKLIKTLQDVNNIKFTDLLCPSLGKLKSSLQINYLINFLWLIQQYKERKLEDKPLTILYGYDKYEDLDEVLQTLKVDLPNVTTQYIDVDNDGCHHTKIGIYIYEDNSLRISISTANLYYDDWNRYNQQLWLSPSCPRLSDDSSDESGESPTFFKNSLLKYLKFYNSEILEPFIEHVKRADFGQIKVFFVSSVPGNHTPQDRGTHLQQVNDLLLRHCNLPDKGALLWKIITHTSSLGMYGKTPDYWLHSVFLKYIMAHKKLRATSRLRPELKIVYPSVDNVLNGYFGDKSGHCLAYKKEFHETQRWLEGFLHRWKADGLERSRVMPHLKSYCRISPCLKKLAWFCLTSANVTRSGWGSGVQKNGNIFVRNYEAGIVFFPQFFDEEFYEIDTLEKNKKLFPFMSDLPLSEYKWCDYPWCL